MKSGLNTGNTRGGRHRHRARGRQEAKRATFQCINSQIVAVADTGDVALTISTIEARVQEMNLVNVSTAMHRLAKLTASSPPAQASLRRHPVLAELLEAARAMLTHARAAGAAPHCQALSNITWALATVQISDVPLLELVTELSHARVAQFKPFELSATLWAIAKLDALDPAACASAARLFGAAAEHVHAHTELFTFRCLVMTAWAFATARQHSTELFRGIAAQMLPMVQTASCQELANAAWAFSTAGVRHNRLFSELAQKAMQQLGDFKPQELSMLLWGLAASGFFHEELSAAQLELSSLLLLLRHLPVAGNEICDSAARRLFQEASRRVDTLRAQEVQVLSRICSGLLGLCRSSALPATELRRACQTLSQVTSWPRVSTGDADRQAWAADELDGAEGQFEARERPEAAVPLQGCQSMGSAANEGMATGAAPALAVLPYYVKNTFLHVDDDSESDSQVDDSDPAKHLPPSLGIIPDSVSPKKLAAYRADYQRFRAGKAIGAKGELCSVAAAAPVAAALAEAAEAPGPDAPEPGLSAKQLPPPLGFVSRDLSLKKLEAYRMDYQRFRAGYASGAKGEVSSSVAEDEVISTPSARLPPPLAIIPRDVSPRKLKAYRFDYQRFRAGNAMGAKGEVAKAVASDEPDFIALDKLAAYHVGDHRFLK